MRTDDLESAFAVHSASVNNNIAVSVDPSPGVWLAGDLTNHKAESTIGHNTLNSPLNSIYCWDFFKKMTKFMTKEMY